MLSAAEIGLKKGTDRGGLLLLESWLGLLVLVPRQGIGLNSLVELESGDDDEINTTPPEDLGMLIRK